MSLITRLFLYVVLITGASFNVIALLLLLFEITLFLDRRKENYYFTLLNKRYDIPHRLRNLYLSELRQVIIDVCQELKLRNQNGLIPKRPNIFISLVNRKTKAKTLILSRIYQLQETINPAIVFGAAFSINLSYLPPEEMEEITKRSQSLEVYALGVIIYEILVGKSAFQGNVTDYSNQKQQPLTSTINLQPFWDNIITKCTDPDKSKRIQSVEELLSVLQQWDKSNIHQKDERVA